MNRFHASLWAVIILAVLIVLMIPACAPSEDPQPVREDPSVHRGDLPPGYDLTACLADLERLEQVVGLRIDQVGYTDSVMTTYPSR